METEYGYPTFGKIYSFVRDVITDDALLEIAKEETPSFNDCDKERLQQQWLRYTKEITKSKNKVKDYKEYRIDENPLFHLAKKHLKKYKKYTGILPTLFINFCFNFFNEINKEFDKRKGALVYEKPLSTIAVLSLNQALIDFFQTASDEHITEFKKVILTIVVFIKTDYEKIFELFKKQSTITVLANQDKLKHLISTYKRNKKNISWSNLNMFINSIPEDFTKENKELCKSLLHTQFLYLQMKNGLITHFNFTDKDFILFANIIKGFQKSTKNLQDNINEQLNNFITPYFDINDTIKATAVNLYNDVFINYKYKEEGIDNFTKRISDEIINVAPHYANFFIPWAKAYIYEAQTLNDKSTEDFYHKKASESFEEAFRNYKYSGSCYLANFLKMAFSFENHYASWIQAKNSINQDNNTTTPLYENAKMYYSFGYAIGLFPNKPSDTYKEAYHSQELYSKYFPSGCFLNEKEGQIKQNKDIKASLGINTCSIDILNNSVEITYNFFKSLNTKAKRNNLIPRDKPLQNNNDINIENQKRLYTPLSLCIQDGQHDDRLWLLALEWLEDNEIEIDIDKLCFNGSTALLEALTQYNHIQHIAYNHEDLEYKSKKDLIRKLILKILEKATYLGATKYQNQIHTLQEAINCYDEEIIYKIADKISNTDFQNYIISADEVSPLYFLQLQRSYLVNKARFLEEYNNPAGIKWENLYVPGALTVKEKQEKFYCKEDDIPPKIIELWYDYSFGYKFKNEILTVYDNVAKYFIDRMDNVDLFKSKPNGTDQEITSLYYAAAFDDKNIARLLLDKGADYNLRLGITRDFDCNYSPTFIYRLITFGSPTTLHMFLTEYKDKAKKVMKKGQDEITPLVYFIRLYLDNYFQNITLEELRYYVSLFIDCGADLDENTEAGCARYFLEEKLHLHL